MRILNLHFVALHTAQEAIFRFAILLLFIVWPLVANGTDTHQQILEWLAWHGVLWIFVDAGVSITAIRNLTSGSPVPPRSTIMRFRLVRGALFGILSLPFLGLHSGLLVVLSLTVRSVTEDYLLTAAKTPKALVLANSILILTAMLILTLTGVDSVIVAFCAGLLARAAVIWRFTRLSTHSDLLRLPTKNFFQIKTTAYSQDLASAFLVNALPIYTSIVGLENLAEPMIILRLAGIAIFFSRSLLTGFLINTKMEVATASADCDEQRLYMAPLALTALLITVFYIALSSGNEVNTKGSLEFLLVAALIFRLIRELLQRYLVLRGNMQITDQYIPLIAVVAATVLVTVNGLAHGFSIACAVNMLPSIEAGLFIIYFLRLSGFHKW